MARAPTTREGARRGRSRRECASASISIWLWAFRRTAPTPGASPRRVLRGVRIGSPPDAFNANGQDWGLAPISPRALQGEQCGPVPRADPRRHRARRRDPHRPRHGDKRLYLIADGLDGTDGAYVQYPFEDLLKAVAGRRNPRGGDHRRGSRHRAAEFPRGHARHTASSATACCSSSATGQDRSFHLPHSYERDALACISTHDLPTLHGWWEGHRLDDRVRIGLDDADAATAYRLARDIDRRRC